jgi:DNA-directed RNA polymerase sigma subunit (sigma70/sigma32)
MPKDHRKSQASELATTIESRRLQTYGFMSLSDIARHLGISKQACQQYHTRAIKKLMAHPVMRQLAVDEGLLPEET